MAENIGYQKIQLALQRFTAGYLPRRGSCFEAPWSRGPKTVPQSMVDAARYFPDDEPGDRQWNRNGHFVKYSLGKRSLAIDLQTDQGQAALARVIPGYHVLLENFSTLVMPQLGFDHERLHDLNPDLIYLTMPGYGRSGPAENWLAYGSCVDSHAGLSSLIGYADETPWQGGIAWPDPIAGLHAASAVLEVLWSSLSSGTGGATIEAAQFESTVAAIGDRVIEAQVDGPFKAQGNRRAGFVGQGIYRCAGDDSWIAISIPDESTLAAFCGVTSIDPATARNHESFDAAVTMFTTTRSASQLAEDLQQARVPAGIVAKAPDLMADPHLASINNWVTVDQPDVGDFTAPVTPINLSVSPLRPPTPAPTLGQHNRQVLEAAGFSATEIDDLTARNTIVDAPPQ